jgi:hypothetical protein
MVGFSLRQHTPSNSFSLSLYSSFSSQVCRDHHYTVFVICLFGAINCLAYSKIEPCCACIKPSWIVGIVMLFVHDLVALACYFGVFQPLNSASSLLFHLLSANVAGIPPQTLKQTFQTFGCLITAIKQIFLLLF